jgi:putative membrane protein
VLQRTGIIGWNVRSSWFQRRVGLAHLTATTAAGKQGYTAYDIPVAEGVGLAHEIDPALIHQFLA